MQMLQLTANDEIAMVVWNCTSLRIRQQSPPLVSPLLVTLVVNTHHRPMGSVCQSGKQRS